MITPPEKCSAGFTSAVNPSHDCTSQADGYYWLSNILPATGLCRNCYKIGLEGDSKNSWKEIRIIWYDSLEHLINLKKES